MGQQDGFNAGELAARTPERDIFGKLDDELSPIRINGEALLAIKRKAGEWFEPTAELLAFIETRKTTARDLRVVGETSK